MTDLMKLIAHRNTMEDLLQRWISGDDVDPDMYAAACTDSRILEVPGLAPAGWAQLKEEYNDEADRLVKKTWNARQAVRIATGHEKIKNLMTRPESVTRVRQGERVI